MKFKRGQNDDAEVSMSPLIDCVFLLLIFFLVSTMAKKQKKDIDIDLPESTSAVELRPDNETVVIGIDIYGDLHYEGLPCSTNQLHQYLQDIAETDPERRIRIDTDAKTPFGRFNEVRDILQFRNLNNVGIRTYDEHYNR